jgi:TRAP-type mannitol/chloroaromatic compound transport system permease large subunit
MIIVFMACLLAGAEPVSEDRLYTEQEVHPVECAEGGYRSGRQYRLDESGTFIPLDEKGHDLATPTLITPRAERLRVVMKMLAAVVVVIVVLGLMLIGLSTPFDRQHTYRY